MTEPGDQQMTRKTAPKQSLADWIAVICTFAVLIVGRFLDRGDIASLRIIGGFIGIVGCLFAFWPMIVMRRHGHVKKGKSYMHTTHVVDHGIFAVVRHPQYLGYILFNVCFMLLSQHRIISMLGVVAIVFFYLHALAEERSCIVEFGAAYREYMERVPRFNIITGMFRALRKTGNTG